MIIPSFRAVLTQSLTTHYWPLSNPSRHNFNVCGVDKPPEPQPGACDWQWTTLRNGLKIGALQLMTISASGRQTFPVGWLLLWTRWILTKHPVSGQGVICFSFHHHQSPSNAAILVEKALYKSELEFHLDPQRRKWTVRRFEIHILIRQRIFLRPGKTNIPTGDRRNAFFLSLICFACE